MLNHATGAVIVQVPVFSFSNVLKNLFWPYNRAHNYEIKFKGYKKRHYEQRFERFWDEEQQKADRLKKNPCACSIMDAFLRTQGFILVAETDRRQSWALPANTTPHRPGQ